MKYIAFTLSLIVGLAANSAAVAEPVTLRSAISVQGDQITFGDIFNGVGEKADYVIAPAPVPGKTTFFNVSSVSFVARKHGLDWRPNRTVKRVSIAREGVRIPRQELVEEIHFALENELQSDLFEISLSTQHPNVQVALDENPNAAVESLSFSRKKGTFVAILEAPANSENARRYKLSGKIYLQRLVPVLNRSVAAGEEIKETDLDFKTFNVSKIGRNMAVDIHEIIGKSPRRTVRTGSPINLNNLGDPVTVEKGKLVSVVLNEGGINLSITGRTLEPGGEGDIIRVENIASRKTIQAQVINASEVRIVTKKNRLAVFQ